MSKRIHVVPHGDGWAARREGATPVGSTHATQAEATATATTTAIRERSEVVIHRPNRKIRGANSYGNDRYPPKG